jgi:ParB-like chromosome segregation protein Spo0J
MEKKMYDLVVDEELERVAPPLAENELEILKEDILEHGCKFPLIVWGDTIVDGHNRYRICKDAGIPFAVEQMEFADKTEAKLWIVKNQLGRRNLRPFQRCEMVLPLEDELKEEAEKRRVAKRAGTPILADEKETRDVLAEMAGVAHGTLDKVKVLVVDADEETLQKLRSGEMKIHTAYMQLRKKDKPKKEEPKVEPDRPKEEPAEEPEEDKPPVVAAYLEGSIPFEPVQRDAEAEFDDILDGWREDVQDLLERLTGENTTEDLVKSLRTKLTDFYTEMMKTIGGLDNE